MITHYLILGALTIAISIFFGFMPWGLIASIALPITMILISALLPTKRYINMSANVAVEGLSYGRLDAAYEHITSALEFAESESKLNDSDIEALKLACKKIADALSNAGDSKKAKLILDRCSNVSLKHFPPRHDA